MKKTLLFCCAALALSAGCRPDRAGGRIELQFAPELSAEVVRTIVPELESAGVRLFRFEADPAAGRGVLSVVAERDAQGAVERLVTAIERTGGSAVRVSGVATGRFAGLREEREVLLLAAGGQAGDAAELVRTRARTAGAVGFEAAESGDTVRLVLPTVMRFEEALGLARAPEFGLYECARGGQARTILKEAAQAVTEPALAPGLERLGEQALASDGQPAVEEAELVALAPMLDEGVALSEGWRLLPGLARSLGDVSRTTLRVVRTTPALGAGAFRRVGAVPYAGPDSTLAGDWHLALALNPDVLPAFTALTRSLAGSRLAVVLDGLVLAAPQVSGPVRDSLLVIAVPGLKAEAARSLARAMAMAAGRPMQPVAAGTFSYRGFRAD